MNGLEAWQEVEVGNECDGCGFYRVIRDMYGTGDSPTEHVCKAVSWQQCFRAEGILEDEDDGQ